MDHWLKIFLLIIVGIAALSLLGVLLNILVGLAFFLLKIVFIIFVGVIIIKIVQEILRKIQK